MLKSVRWAWPRSSRRMLSGLRSLDESGRNGQRQGIEEHKPMNDTVLMEEGERRGQLCDVKADGVFW